jgi:hypothetical protein
MKILYDFQPTLIINFKGISLNSFGQLLYKSYFYLSEILEHVTNTLNKRVYIYNKGL